MNSIFLFLGLLGLRCYTQKVQAQDSTSSFTTITSGPAAVPTTFISITPEMSASSVSSFFNALATNTPQQPGDGAIAGDVASTPGAGDSDAGAQGSDDGSITISKNGLIAIIVVVSIVAFIGSECYRSLHKCRRKEC